MVRYVEPAEFERYREFGLSVGFKYVASGPLVRSSYKAAEAFLRGILKGEARFESSYGARAPDGSSKRSLRVVS